MRPTALRVEWGVLNSRLRTPRSHRSNGRCDFARHAKRFILNFPARSLSHFIGWTKRLFARGLGLEGGRKSHLTLICAECVFNLNVERLAFDVGDLGLDATGGQVHPRLGG